MTKSSECLGLCCILFPAIACRKTHILALACVGRLLPEKRWKRNNIRNHPLRELPNTSKLCLDLRSANFRSGDSSQFPRISSLGPQGVFIFGCIGDVSLLRCHWVKIIKSHMISKHTQIRSIIVDEAVNFLARPPADNFSFSATSFPLFAQRLTDVWCFALENRVFTQIRFGRSANTFSIRFAHAWAGGSLLTTGLAKWVSMYAVRKIDVIAQWWHGSKILKVNTD